MKFQIPNDKFRINSKHQFPNTETILPSPSPSPVGEREGVRGNFKYLWMELIWDLACLREAPPAKALCGGQALRRRQVLAV